MVNTDDLITLKNASKISELNQEYVAKLIRNGKLWGSKLGGRNWIPTDEALQDYFSQERKPGPRPNIK